MFLLEIIALAAAYLIGSLSSAVIVSKCYGMADPRSYGSGNPGATNVLRSGNKKAAAFTLLGDALKGVLAVAAALWLHRSAGFGSGFVALAAVAVLLGHLFPVFFGFKGGKGVATALGILLTLSLPTALVCLIVWLLVAFRFKTSSLAALAATAASPIAAFIFMPYASWGWATVLIAALVLYRHKSNIANLLAGKESKIGDSAGK